jgi:hypothetical protein
MIFKLSLPSVEKNTRQRTSLPSVLFLTLGKDALYRVLKRKHSAKKLFAECFVLTRAFLALGK